MNMYCELADSILSPKGKYLVMHNLINDQGLRPSYRYRLMSQSDRVWVEDQNGVRFIKNRFSDIYDTCGYDIDMEEFLMIKLMSEPV